MNDPDMQPRLTPRPPDDAVFLQGVWLQGQGGGCVGSVNSRSLGPWPPWAYPQAACVRSHRSQFPQFYTWLQFSGSKCAKLFPTNKQGAALFLGRMLHLPASTPALSRPLPCASGLAAIFEGVAAIEAEAYSLLHRLGARPAVSEVRCCAVLVRIGVGQNGPVKEGGGGRTWNPCAQAHCQLPLLHSRMA